MLGYKRFIDLKEKSQVHKTLMSIMIENLFCHLGFVIFLALGGKPEGSSKPDLYSSIIRPIYSVLLDMPS